MTYHKEDALYADSFCVVKSLIDVPCTTNDEAFVNVTTRPLRNPLPSREGIEHLNSSHRLTDHKQGQMCSSSRKGRGGTNKARAYIRNFLGVTKDRVLSCANHLDPASTKPLSWSKVILNLCDDSKFSSKVVSLSLELRITSRSSKHGRDRASS